MSEQQQKQSWHLEKGVPISIIGVLVLQILGFGALYGRLENRVTNMEARQTEAAQAARQVPERLARVETLLEILLQRLDQRDQASRPSR